MNDRGNPPGKPADAELHFADGPLAGLKLGPQDMMNALTCDAHANILRTCQR